METDTFDVSVSAEEKEEMPKIWNFSAGPGMLPRPVLEAVQREFLDYRGLGASIVEMSHRTHAVEAIVESLTDGLRGLLAIPEDFEIFFTQGGGRTQFAMVPANLLRGKTGAYLVTGLWSAAALEEARRIGRAEAVVRTEGDVPDATECDWPDAAYVYYCDNETVHGIEFSAPPMAPEGVPLVADMSSNFLTRPIDWSRHGVVWAAAQKNFTPAGLTVVIARRDLLGGLLAHMPSMFDWALYAREKSMPNTPPVFQLYIADLVAKWVRSEGGVEELPRRALERSSLLYEALDARPDLYVTNVARRARSRVNVPFALRNPDDLADFIAAGEREGFRQFTGHASVGGLRVSLYNAMPLEGPRRFAEFLRAWRP